MGYLPFRQTFVLDFVREPGLFYITLLMDVLKTGPRIAVFTDQFSVELYSGKSLEICG